MSVLSEYTLRKLADAIGKTAADELHAALTSAGAAPVFDEPDGSDDDTEPIVVTATPIVDSPIPIDEQKKE